MNNTLKLYNNKNRKGEQTVKHIGVEFKEKEITFELLEEGAVQRFKKGKKMTQLEFFLMKLNQIIVDKSLERAEVYQIMKEHDINFKLDKSGKNSTMDRAIREWRGKDSPKLSKQEELK